MNTSRIYVIHPQSSCCRFSQALKINSFLPRAEGAEHRGDTAGHRTQQGTAESQRRGVEGGKKEEAQVALVSL